MYNILIDTEYILFRGVHSAMPKSRRGDWLSKPRDIEVSLEAVKSSLHFALKPFARRAGNILCVTDCHSWRKRAEYMTGTTAEYKAQRERVFDGDGFAELRRQVREYLGRFGVGMIACDGAEGDDLLCFLSRLNLRNGKNTLIVSSDHDLFQLLTRTSNGSVIMTDGAGKVFLPSAEDGQFELFGEDIFVNEMRGDSALKLMEVQPLRTLFCKVLHGDVSDNIKSIYVKRVGNRNMTCSENMSLRILDTYEAETGERVTMEWFDDPGRYFTERFYALVKSKLKIADGDPAGDALKGNLEHNCKMIRLSLRMIPIEVSRAMSDAVHEYVKTARPCKAGMLMDDLTASKSSVSGIFSGLDTGDDDLSFIKG